MTTTDSLKAKGLYVEAGANAYANDEDRAYGCHFGMRSDRLAAIADFERGYDEAKAEANLSSMEEKVKAGKGIQRMGGLMVDMDLETGEVFYGRAGRDVERKQAVVYLRVYFAGSDYTRGESHPYL